MFTLFLLIYFSFFTFLAYRKLDWAVLLAVFALPAYLIRFKIFGLPATLLEGMIWIVFLTWLARNFRAIAANLKSKWRKEGRVMRYPFDWEISLLLVVSLIAVAIAGFTDSAFGIWKAYFFEPILFFIVIVNIFKSFYDLKKILWALAASAFAVSVFAIYQKFTGNFIFNPLWADTETRRVVSFFGYPNAVGLYLGPLVLIFIGWLAQEMNGKENINKILQGAAIFSVLILAIPAIVFAKSEGAIIGIAAGFFFFLLLNRKLWPIAGGLAVAVLLILHLNQSVFNYAKEKIILNDFSGQVRKLQWAETWEMFKDGRIISGSGLANYQASIAPYHREGFFFNKDNDPEFHRKTVFNEEYRKRAWQPLEIYLYPHNIFLNFWAELGLAGLILFIWIIGKYFKNGLGLIIGKTSESNYFIAGLLGAMLVIVVHGLVDVPYFKNDLAIMFWVMIAMLGIIRLNAKSSL